MTATVMGQKTTSLTINPTKAGDYYLDIEVKYNLKGTGTTVSKMFISDLAIYVKDLSTITYSDLLVYTHEPA